ncbi:hypothetical protein RI367_006760 [Sorochytrium milnesiophthora]
MDEPLFLNDTRNDKLYEKAAETVIFAFAGLTVLFGVINGFAKSAAHLFYALELAALVACEFNLIKWYRLGDVDPKFKYLILGLGGCILLQSILGNVYFWASA